MRKSDQALVRFAQELQIKPHSTSETKVCGKSTVAVAMLFASKAVIPFSGNKQSHNQRSHSISYHQPTAALNSNPASSMAER